jgi:GNAT superfamily N-acetyltransferase
MAGSPCSLTSGSASARFLGQLGGQPVIGVGPLAVSPAHQDQGIGTALMKEIVGRADRAGLPLPVLLGDPACSSPGASHQGRASGSTLGQAPIQYELGTGRLPVRCERRAGENGFCRAL